MTSQDLENLKPGMAIEYLGEPWVRIEDVEDYHSGCFVNVITGRVQHCSRLAALLVPCRRIKIRYEYGWEV